MNWWLLLVSHPLSMLGVMLTTLAGISWVFVLPLQARGEVDNPYIGLLIFLALPLVFLLGLILIPIGFVLSRRRIARGFASLPERRTALRRLGIFLAVTTALNILIASQLSYRAVHHMDSKQFCGQTCHVMQPHFVAHQRPFHQQVRCVECHVAPGASGWVESKMAGLHQLVAIVTNDFHRPIGHGENPRPVVPAAQTCENCHARNVAFTPKLKIFTKFQEDEQNTRTQTVMMLPVSAIHSAHMGSGKRVRFAAEGPRKETIPWIELLDASSGQTRTYTSGGAARDESLTVFEMQCTDCHNRPAHNFETPEQAVDQEIASGNIAQTLPSIKQTGVGLLTSPYKDRPEALREIPLRLRQFYKANHPQVSSARGNDIEQAGQALTAAWSRNVFPDMKVTWGTYPSHLGHTDSPGCFRCHGGEHTTASRDRGVTQDCGSCHTVLAMEEPSPEILSTLGIRPNPGGKR